MDQNDTKLPEQDNLPTEGMKLPKKKKRHGNALTVEQVKDKLKAKTLFTIFKETGKLNLTEGVRRFYPNQKNPNEYVEYMGKPEIMEEFCKLVRVDESAVKNLKSDKIIQDLLEDVNRLNLLLDSGEISPDEVVKIINAKSGTNKLLGMFLGMWKQDKPQQTDQDSPDELWNKFSGRLTPPLSGSEN